FYPRALQRTEKTIRFCVLQHAARKRWLFHCDKMLRIPLPNKQVGVTWAECADWEVANLQRFWAGLSNRCAIVRKDCTGAHGQRSNDKCRPEQNSWMHR